MTPRRAGSPPNSCRPPLPFCARASGIALAVIALAGCGAEEARGPSVVVRDSSGITIVENEGVLPPGGGGWALAAEPSVEIGGLGEAGESQLYRVRGSVRLPDGRIAVGNSGSGQILLFGPDGLLLQGWGGEGEGPGEFQSLELAGLMGGDTLVAVDRRLRRISLFHPDQGFIRSASVAASEVYFLWCRGLFADGSPILEGMVFGDEEAEGYSRPGTWYQSFRPDGALGTDFGEFPGTESVMVIRQTNHGIASVLEDIPFGRRGVSAVGGDRFYYGSQDSYEIRVHDSSGDLIGLVRAARSPVRVTDAHLEAFVEMEVARASDENEARSLRERFQGAPVPESHPAYAGLLADAAGFLFVEEYRLPGDDVPVLTVFDPEGRMVGSLPLPEGLEVLEIGPSHVLGIHRDAMDVESLRLYELTRPEG